MVTRTQQERATGALMGAFIGEALGVGPHWYYNLDEQHKDYGSWIDDYTEPKPHRYHAGLKPGQLSQPGYILRLTLQSLVEQSGYDQEDFCRRFDQVLFPQLDGTPTSGPGGYTSQSIRDAWKKRVKMGATWSECAGQADDTEAIERTLAIAVRYASRPADLARSVASNTLLTQKDEMVVAMTVAYGALLGLLVQGDTFDGQISGELMRLVKDGSLPFHAVTSDNLQPPQAGVAEPPRVGNFASPDALLSPSFMAKAAADGEILIEPAWKVSLVYGMPCAIYHILPASYYLAARFKDDFESAVLHAINGGGQNQARAMLTGALVGAQVGLRGIPRRFIDGLEEGAELLDLSQQLAAQSAG